MSELQHIMLELVQKEITATEKKLKTNRQKQDAITGSICRINIIEAKATVELKKKSPNLITLQNLNIELNKQKKLSGKPLGDLMDKEYELKDHIARLHSISREVTTNNTLFATSFI